MSFNVHAMTAVSTEAKRTPEAMTARVVEVGDVTAGIAVPEHRGVRFYSSQQVFDILDGQLFRTFEQANRAARERAPGSGRVGGGLRRRAG